MIRLVAFLAALLCAAPAWADIALRGTPVTNLCGNCSTITVNMPSGTTTDDVVYCVSTAAATTDLDLVEDSTTWTELTGTDLYSNDTEDTNSAVFRKVQGGSPDASVTFSGGGSVNRAGICYAFSGANTTTPEDQTPTTVSGAAQSTPVTDPASIVTQTANAWVLVFGVNTEADTVTAPTNYENLAQQAWPASAVRNAHGATRVIASPTTEDPGTFGGIAGSNSDSFTAVTIAIRPAGGGGGGGTKTRRSLMGVGS